MTEIAFQNQSLERPHQKTADQKLQLKPASLQCETADTADAICNLDQSDRGRVIVFIDGANLFYAASQLSIEIDYLKLLDYLADRDCLVHAFFYTGYDPIDQKQHNFLHWMNHNGFRVVTKTIKRAANGAKSANLDVEIAVDMMRLAQHCDTAVLVSGDGDFTYVLNTIAEQGVRTEVVGLRSMTNIHLINTANCYIDLAGIRKTVQKLDDRCCRQMG